MTRDEERWKSFMNPHFVGLDKDISSPRWQEISNIQLNNTAEFINSLK